MAFSRGGSDVGGTGGTHSAGFATFEVPGLFDGTAPPPPGAPPGAPGFPKIDFPLSNTGGIAGGMRGPAAPPQSAMLKVTVRWQAAGAIAAPTDDTPQ